MNVTSCIAGASSVHAQTYVSQFHSVYDKQSSAYHTIHVGEELQALQLETLLFEAQLVVSILTFCRFVYNILINMVTTCIS